MLLPHRFPRLTFAVTVSAAALGCGGGENLTVPPTTGSLEITTSTSGTEPDADGYSVQIDAGPPQAIGAAATLTATEVTPGNHTVQLAEMAGNCTVAGDNPRTVSVTAGEVARVSFTVACPTPALQWQAMASGTDALLTSVWGSSATDVFALGESGGIFHFDGRGWSKQGPDLSASLLGVWGSGPNDAFAVGFGSGSEGSIPYIAHYDGTSWTGNLVPVPPPSGRTQDLALVSVWGTSGSNVYAVGYHWDSYNHKLVMHYDGTTWSDAGLPFPAQLLNLTDVSGTSPNDVYTIGYDDSPDFPTQGYVLHYDGSQWTFFAYPEPGVVLNGVWNSSPSDVFAVGFLDDPSGIVDRRGLILHYDGSTWSRMAIPTVAFLADVWGTSGTDVYAVGDGILHYDGQNWTKVSDQGGNDVWGSSSADVFVVGGSGRILHGTR